MSSRKLEKEEEEETDWPVEKIREVTSDERDDGRISVWFRVKWLGETKKDNEWQDLERSFYKEVKRKENGKTVKEKFVNEKVKQFLVDQQWPRVEQILKLINDGPKPGKLPQNPTDRENDDYTESTRLLDKFLKQQKRIIDAQKAAAAASVTPAPAPAIPAKPSAVKPFGFNPYAAQPSSTAGPVPSIARVAPAGAVNAIANAISVVVNASVGTLSAIGSAPIAQAPTQMPSPAVPGRMPSPTVPVRVPSPAVPIRVPSPAVPDTQTILKSKFAAFLKYQTDQKKDQKMTVFKSLQRLYEKQYVPSKAEKKAQTIFFEMENRVQESIKSPVGQEKIQKRIAELLQLFSTSNKLNEDEMNILSMEYENEIDQVAILIEETTLLRDEFKTVQGPLELMLKNLVQEREAGNAYTQLLAKINLQFLPSIGYAPVPPKASQVKFTDRFVRKFVNPLKAKGLPIEPPIGEKPQLAVTGRRLTQPEIGQTQRNMRPEADTQIRQGFKTYQGLDAEAQLLATQLDFYQDLNTSDLDRLVQSADFKSLVRAYNAYEEAHRYLQKQVTDNTLEISPKRAERSIQIRPPAPPERTFVPEKVRFTNPETLFVVPQMQGPLKTQEEMDRIRREIEQDTKTKLLRWKYISNLRGEPFQSLVNQLQINKYNYLSDLNVVYKLREEFEIKEQTNTLTREDFENALLEEFGDVPLDSEAFDTEWNLKKGIKKALQIIDTKRSIQDDVVEQKLENAWDELLEQGGDVEEQYQNESREIFQQYFPGEPFPGDEAPSPVPIAETEVIVAQTEVVVAPTAVAPTAVAPTAVAQIPKRSRFTDAEEVVAETSSDQPKRSRFTDAEEEVTVTAQNVSAMPPVPRPVSPPVAPVTALPQQVPAPPGAFLPARPGLNPQARPSGPYSIGPPGALRPPVPPGPPGAQPPPPGAQPPPPGAFRPGAQPPPPGAQPPPRAQPPPPGPFRPGAQPPPPGEYPRPPSPANRPLQSRSPTPTSGQKRSRPDSRGPSQNSQQRR